MNKTSFSSHALQQFSRRLCVQSYDSIIKMRYIFDCCEEIDREEAYELIQYEQILNKKNRYNKYYAVSFDRDDILSLFENENYHLDITSIVGVFIVKDGKCVTFKTSNDHEIWECRPKGQFSSKFLTRKQKAHLATLELEF